jgi:hypothetical protein
MNPFSFFSPRTFVFYGFLPWFLTKVTVLLIVGAKCGELAVRWSSIWWLSGIAFCACGALLLVLRYNTEMIVVHEATLVCRCGTLLTNEMTLPLWPLVLEIRQNLLERALNYGTIRLRINGTTIELRNIAHVGFLRALIVQRQANILLSRQIDGPLPTPRDRPRVA